jgi:23S rRNA (cytosine1962-C5)-methyltransferase
MSDRDYELIDAGDGAKLERFGRYVVERPAAQAVWARHNPSAWKRVDARFERAGTKGTWDRRGMPDMWPVEIDGLTFTAKVNEHGNIGLFPEHASLWPWVGDQVRTIGRGCRVLNLFAYTGSVTLAAARAGAEVVHLDASKTSVDIARRNAEESRLDDASIRWIVDDAMRFVHREQRRGNRYQAIVLDPPTFGRGPTGQLWKIEADLAEFVDTCCSLLADGPSFVVLTCHSPGFTPLVLENLLRPHATGPLSSGEMTVMDRGGRPLPSGAYARWSASS